MPLQEPKPLKLMYGVSCSELSGGDTVLSLDREMSQEALNLLPSPALVVCERLIVGFNPFVLKLMGREGAGREPVRLEDVLIAPALGGGTEFPLFGSGRMRFEALLRNGRELPTEVSVASQAVMCGGKPAFLLVMLEHASSRPVAGEVDASFLEDVLEGAPGASVVTHDGNVLHVNSEFVRMFGYSHAETVGRNLDELVVPDGRMHEVEMFEHELHRLGRATLDTERRTRTGERLEVQVMISRLRLGGAAGSRARGRFVSYRDIREQKKEEARLLHSALHDTLTGLPNRRHFLDRAELMLARLRRRPDRGFAVFFLDLDGFKKVNDELGHAAGDALLLTMAERLKACLRPQDTVARFGGDEFALLLDESGTAGELEVLAGRLQVQIGQVFVWMGQEARVGASIGIARAEHHETAEQLLHAADIAMYVAKNSGKRCFSIAPDKK